MEETGAFCGNLLIDLSALKDNYAQLDGLTGPGCEVAGALKADAYGLGAVPVAKALYQAGCRTYFVATPEEALEIRPHLQAEAAIAVLHGYDPHFAREYESQNLTPVLNSLPQIAHYAKARWGETPKPAILHFDTGMNRLGIERQEAERLNENKDLLEGMTIKMVMSHFASSEEQGNPKNTEQALRYHEIAKKYQGVAKSLCNSSAIFTNKAWHLDMVRPGMALYGLNPTPESKNPMRRVVSLNAPVLQIKKARTGETVGYNETYRFDKETPLAIIGVGYADGLFRSLSNAGSAYWKGRKLPIRGRISMDLIICDLSALPENEFPLPGDRLELIGPHQSADELAIAAGTIGYEILTALGRRYKRIYKA